MKQPGNEASCIVQAGGCNQSLSESRHHSESEFALPVELAYQTVRLPDSEDQQDNNCY